MGKYSLAIGHEMKGTAVKNELKKSSQPKTNRFLMSM